MVFIGEPSTGKSSFLNITDEYCVNQGYLTCNINLSLEISCYEFFKEIFISVLTAISEKTESNAAKSALRTYRSMINTGVGQLDFHFPQEYFYWAQRERSFDVYPSMNTLITDFKTLHQLLLTELEVAASVNEKKPNMVKWVPKIVLLIDDFQKIIGFDEHGEINDDSSRAESLNSNAGSISESLRTLIEEIGEKWSAKYEKNSR